jgi:hypothetical protein
MSIQTYFDLLLLTLPIKLLDFYAGLALANGLKQNKREEIGINFIRKK